MTVKDRSEVLDGRIFPIIDFLNVGIHKGGKNGNEIDQRAYAEAMRHGADLVESAALTAIGGEATMRGMAGEKRRLTVTNVFELPD